MKQFSLKFVLALALVFFNASLTFAQSNESQARAILDRTAKVIGKAEGASASFCMSHPSGGTVSGTIAIKGNKFNVRSPQSIVWFNGKTQWTYMKKNNEVNISTPNVTQQQMINPYTFVNLYKNGYKLSSKSSANGNEVHLVSAKRGKGIQEMYITINKKTYVPSMIKMKHGGKWYRISISNFSNRKQPNSAFTFNSKDYPSAEIIDLR